MPAGSRHRRRKAATPPASPAVIDPARLSVSAASRVLSNLAGIQIAAASIRADIEAGAPRNEDGTISLVNYAAWLAREAGRRA